MATSADIHAMWVLLMLTFSKKSVFYGSFALTLIAASAMGCDGDSTATKAKPAEVKEEKKQPAAPVPLPESTEEAHVYRLSFEERGRHLLTVEAFFTASGDETLLMMATWTPGSYLIREYARHVQDIEALTPEGKPLSIQKLSKNRWSVATKGQKTLVVRYKLYARDMSVRTNFLDADLAVLNGAPTFITRPEELDRPHIVELEVPKAWRGCVSGMPQVEGAKESGKEQPAMDRALGRRFVASDFDQLVDSPILCGSPTVHRFWALSKEYVFANSDESDGWNGEKSVADLKRIVEEQVSFWGEVPYERYVFLNVNEGGGGGLEHMNSTLMLSDRFVTDERESYLAWLGLVSHEFFHTWNAKRLRPEALGPFDYENENLTPDLWIVEGFTSYYGDLLLARAGVMTDEEYLDELSKTIERVQSTPGRSVQSLRSASFDAWIKYYRPDDNAVNSAISYYGKGALVAFLLDAKIREASRQKQCLDDVMRAAYQRFSGDRGYSTEAFRALASEVAGVDLSGFFASYVDGTAELDYGPALSFYGLRFKESEAEDKHRFDAGPESGGEEQAGSWLGVELSDRGFVTSVRSDGPASGHLNVDDEILALEGFRLSAETISKRLERYPPGRELTLLVARRGKVVEIVIKTEKAPSKTWKLEPHPKATMTAKHNRFLWLTDARRDDKK